MGGPKKGLHPVNIHPDIFHAVSTGDGIDGSLYLRLCTEIDLDGLYDLLELKTCSASWAHAAAINAENAPRPIGR
jgi:hypothetical protein